MGEGPKQTGCFGFDVSSLGTTGPVAPRPKQAGGVGMKDGGEEDDAIYEVTLKPHPHSCWCKLPSDTDINSPCSADCRASPQQ